MRNDHPMRRIDPNAKLLRHWMLHIIHNRLCRHGQINQRTIRIRIPNLMGRLGSPGATADDISRTKGTWSGVLAVDELSVAFEDVEYFFDGVVVVVGEGCFAGGDAND